MLSKETIERQLAHFKHNCTSSMEETEGWIKALEWVLGDEKHRAVYKDSIENLEHIARDGWDIEGTPSVREHSLRVALLFAIQRLK